MSGEPEIQQVERNYEWAMARIIELEEMIQVMQAEHCDWRCNHEKKTRLSCPRCFSCQKSIQLWPCNSQLEETHRWHK